MFFLSIVERKDYNLQQYNSVYFYLLFVPIFISLYLIGSLLTIILIPAAAVSNYTMSTLAFNFTFNLIFLFFISNFMSIFDAWDANFY